MEENTKENKAENMLENVTENTTKTPQKKKRGRILFILLLIVIAAGVLAIVYLRNSGNMQSQNGDMSEGEPAAALTTAQPEEVAGETASGEVAADKAAEETAAGDKAAEEKAVQEAETEEGAASPGNGDTQGPSIFEDGLQEEDNIKDLALEGAGEGIETLFKPEELTDAEKVSQEEEGSDTADANYTDTEYEETIEDIEMTNTVNAEDYTEEEFRELCTEIGYKKLLREKEQHLGAALLLEVTVMSQVDGGLFDTNVYYLCKAMDAQGIERYYILRDDRVEKEMEESPGEEIMLILEGDRILVYGQLFDSCKLPAYLVSSQPVVPAVSMVYVDIEE